MLRTQAQRWGELWARFQDPDRPHKMLALDGGGIRGLITLGILKKLEERLGKPLCEFFDYIAGTSTGAIIAAGLARGMPVAQLIDFYRKSGKDMFEKASLLKRLSSFYEADPLRQRLRQVFGEETNLEPRYLKCLVLVVMQNITTDSPWPISSNPCRPLQRSRPPRLQPAHPALATGARQHGGAGLLPSRSPAVG